MIRLKKELLCIRTDYLNLNRRLSWNYVYSGRNSCIVYIEISTEVETRVLCILRSKQRWKLLYCVYWDQYRGGNSCIVYIEISTEVETLVLCILRSIQRWKLLYCVYWDQYKGGNSCIVYTEINVLDLLKICRLL